MTQSARDTQASIPSMAGPSGPGIRLPKASDVLADRIRAEILGKDLQPGDSLSSEAELIEAHGFSRGTVREALRLLEAEGLIGIKRGPKGGIRVRYPDTTQVSHSLALHFAMSKTTLGEFFTFRRLVEPAAAAEAARSATPEQRSYLIEIAEQFRGLPPSLERAPEFHGAIGLCSNNGVYKVILSALHRVIEWHSLSERLSDEDIEGTTRVHRAIARSIEKGDARGASRLMNRHLESFEAVLAQQGRLDQQIIPTRHWQPDRSP